MAAMVGAVMGIFLLVFVPSSPGTTSSLGQIREPFGASIFEAFRVGSGSFAIGVYCGTTIDAASLDLQQGLLLSPAPGLWIGPMVTRVDNKEMQRATLHGGGVGIVKIRRLIGSFTWTPASVSEGLLRLDLRYRPFLFRGGFIFGLKAESTSAEKWYFSDPLRRDLGFVFGISPTVPFVGVPTNIGVTLWTNREVTFDVRVFGFEY